MSTEDRLRSWLHSAASSMSVGSASLSDVQRRAARLQRRRNVTRGGLGVCALVAVAAIGVGIVRSGQLGDLTSTVNGGSDEEMQTSAVAEAAEIDIAQDMWRGVEPGSDAAPPTSVVRVASSEPSRDEATESSASIAGPSDGERADSQISDATSEETSDDSAQLGETASGSSTQEVAEFSTTVRVVTPPQTAEDGHWQYWFSGAHAVTQAANQWYTFDGEAWTSVGLPADLKVVAVDLSTSGRSAILGVVRPLECHREQVIGVFAGGNWSYVRVNNDVPTMVRRDLLDARIRVTDTAIEIERLEYLWLDEACAEDETLSSESLQLVEDLQRLGDFYRMSWLHVPLDGGFAERWPAVASADANTAAQADARLDWIRTRPPQNSINAPPPLKERRPASDDVDSQGAGSLILHQTVVGGVEAMVHVVDGSAILERGSQIWEICPVSDEELDYVFGVIGSAGEHLAVVIGKPEQELFIVERSQ